MKFKILFFMLGVGLLWSCEETEVVTDEDIEAQLVRIQSLAQDQPCTDSSQWRFVEYGYKACGGPEGYLAYSTQIDTVSFLATVREYNKDRKRYVEEENLISDCAFELPPVGVNCVDGQAQLVYDSCELIPNSGPCEAIIPKYFFNPETQECESFDWGGCSGVVPFESLEECQQCESN